MHPRNTAFGVVINFHSTCYRRW